MKRPNEDEISRWLNDDTLVAQAMIDGKWVEVSTSPVNWKVVRTSIATVEGKPVFEGDTYYNEYGQERTAHIGLTDSWDKCALTPPKPKPKSILDSDEFSNLVVSSLKFDATGLFQGQTFNVFYFLSGLDKLKQFLRDHKDEI